MKRFFWLGLALFLCLVWCGCGDTFRPIIIPNPPVFPNPKAANTVVSINDNGTVVPGSAMVVDVSGDTDVSTFNVGLAPVHAVQQNAGTVLVANHSVSCVPPLPCSNSLTKLNFSGTTIASSNTVSLPANSAPNFVAVAPSATIAYVALPGYAPPSVGVVNTLSNSLVNTIPVGNNPDAIAVTPDNTKVYVANQGDGTVDGFTVSSTINLTPRTINNASFNAPLWLIARSDNQRVYVLNGNGVVSTIDTTTTAGPDNVIDASINVPGAAYMLYDGNLNRLYIPWGSQLTMLDVSQSIPVVITGAPIPIPTVVPGSRLASDPCSLTSAQPLAVAAVTALPDGSRAYVGSYYEDASDNICPQVTVINVMSNSVQTSIAVPGFPAYDAFCGATRFRITMAAGGDSSRAYLASCDGGMVNIIDTTSDTYYLNLQAPISARPPIPPNLQNPPQNPIFLFAGP